MWWLGCGRGGLRAGQPADRGSESHHVGLPSERPPRIFPDLRSVGVLPARLRRAELRLDLLRGHAAGDGGEIRASDKGRREREERKAEAGLWHDIDPMRYDHELERRLSSVNAAMLVPIPRSSVPRVS